MSTLIETRQEYKVKKPKTVSIEQYFDPEFQNLGLEKYGLSMMEDGGVSEDLGYTTFGNKVRYLTGLDPYAKSVTSITDPIQRDAVVKEIESIVNELEKVLGQGVLDPTNVEFWSQIKLEVRGLRKYLDLTDTKDIILYYCIKGGGFSEVAPSYEAAKVSSNKIYKFYLQELEEISAVKTETKKEKNAAKAELEKIRLKEPSKLFKLAKVLLSSDHQFTHSTPPDYLYDKLDDFIEGTIVKTNKRKTPTDFLAAAKFDKVSLNLRAIVIDAIYNKFITLKSDNMYYNFETGSLYGRNIEEVVSYLSNPLNSTELDNITERVENKWNK